MRPVLAKVHNMNELIAQYHSELLTIWAQNAEAEFPGMDKMPYLGQAPQFNRLDVVFLGINPSFREKMLSDHWDIVHPTVNARTLSVKPWHWCGNRAEEDLALLREQLVALDQYSMRNYPIFYKPLEQVAVTAGCLARLGRVVRWHALDMFPVRALFQNELEPYLPIDGQWHQLAETMFERSLRLLIDMKPQVVIVANALVANLLIQKMPMRQQANGHRYETNRLPGVPFLFSRILSNGADQFSKERLAADLGNALRGQLGL